MTSVSRFALVLLLVGFTGCTTSTITNLSPRQQPRSANGLYLFEAAWETRQQSLRPESITPVVVVGDLAYPMRPSPLTNRWETLVPIPPDTSMVVFQYKFDFLYNTLRGPQRDSRTSQSNVLYIIDR